MAKRRLLAHIDTLVRADWTKSQEIEQLGDTVLLGEWFVFCRAGWQISPGTAGLPEGKKSQTLSSSPNTDLQQDPLILFRGQEKIHLPSVGIDAKPLPRPALISFTCDKSLYRVRRDTVRLLIASPQTPQAELTLALSLHGNSFATYQVKLDQYGLALQGISDLPEGEYRAELLNTEADPCHFEVAEYQLSPLNAELVSQELSNQTLRYTLSVTAFGQPYSGTVEVELTEKGRRVDTRKKVHCNAEGYCQGTVSLTGTGPYALNVIAGERSATVSLKGSEQQRRETLLVSELGEERELSLLPLPQANMCRGMFITRGGVNNEPFLVRRIVGQEIEIVARTRAELLCAVLIDPARGTSEQKAYDAVEKEERLSLPVPSPYGIVVLGALIDGEPWEGWCAVLRPSELAVRCEAPKEARPGERITITLTTGSSERVVPVHLVVKDQRLVTASDPQVELAARIKKNLAQWGEVSVTGTIERTLRAVCTAPLPPPSFMPMMAANSPDGFPVPQPVSAPRTATMRSKSMLSPAMSAMAAVGAIASAFAPEQERAHVVAAPLAKVRLHFPEVIHNSIVYVKGEARVEVKLGDSMTRYTVEAFALEPVTLDWQRVEKTVDAVQPVYGELTLSPFVFTGDPVMGRLYVGAASGAALVEVRHDDEVLPLFHENGKPIAQGYPIAAGDTLRFPVRPGMITAIVRDASRGGVDVSERYVTEPGKMRHIRRFLRLLTPGETVTLRDLPAIELRPLPGLERPFKFFVESASAYPHGCIEQTSSKLLAMFTGYIINQDEDEALAREYAAVLPVWFKRLQSMYVPGDGFAFYPPEETGGKRTRSDHYAPLAVKHLLKLPTAEESGARQRDVLAMLTAIRAMASDAANYHKVQNPPTRIDDCHTAYRVVLAEQASQEQRQKAVSFVRSRLSKQGMHASVSVPDGAKQYYGTQVAMRAETAYAAATLFACGELAEAWPATNYVIEQLNEEGRLYSTVDTAACLALLLEMRKSGVAAQLNETRVLVNEQEMPLSQALTYEGKVESVRCLAGLATVQVTAEVLEDWSAFARTIPVEVRLEKGGAIQSSFVVGDALDLVVRVPQYEPGLVVHVCLPDALARVVGGGQVKRFSLDFSGQDEVRIPLAAVSATTLPGESDAPVRKNLLQWLGLKKQGDEEYAQHWAVIVRNMFKEEAVGNPGLLEVVVRGPAS
jgi:hypothetical protein